MSKADIFIIVAAVLLIISIAVLILIARTIRFRIVKTIRRRDLGKEDAAFREVFDEEIGFRQEAELPPHEQFGIEPGDPGGGSAGGGRRKKARKYAPKRRTRQSQEQTRLRSEDERRRHEEELRRNYQREFPQRLERSHEQDGARENRELQPVRFHALWHRNTEPGIWQTMLVYIFSGPRGIEGARADFARRMTVPSLYDDSSAIATERIRYGTQISIHPELPGFRFNPPFSSILWLEDWHCTEFRMQALPETKSLVGEQLKGRVAFYVGPLLIGETELLTQITEQAPLSGSDTRELWTEAGVNPYRAIFVSYSHQDSYIVDQLERAYRALGDAYLRDVSVLRSGEAWDPALLEKIYEADIFQLCWSEAAKQSPNVQREWRYAVDLRRRSFIRPMYWEKPMPEPPHELGSIQFAYLPLDEVDL